jgi:hypothetical protein
LYPSAYYSYPQFWERLTEWSESTFQPELLYVHTVKSKTNPANDGLQMIRVHRICPSLASMGKKFAAYSQDEIAVLYPRRAWMLRTFYATESVRYALS